MKHPTTTFPPSCDRGIHTGEGETGWETWDAAAWRLTALDLLDVDLQRTYLELGCKSIAQYADWELGLLPGYAAELLRIAQKLLDLPEIDRALCAGELTWEQVVVLTKVAVPEHELAWLDTALELSLGDLKRLVDCSAEGWAPPIARGVEADVGGHAPCASVETLRATPSPRRARVGGSRFQVGPRFVRRMGAVPAPGAPDRSIRRHLDAPHVRQPFQAPPSTT
jgi:hypothetical protein